MSSAQRGALRYWGMTMLAVAGMAIFGGVSSPAAGAVDVTACAGTENATFSPGELLAPRRIHVSIVDELSCTSTDPTIVSARVVASYTAVVGCLTPLALTTGDTFDVTWNTRETSTFTAAAATNSVVAGQVVNTAEGSFVAGKFRGSVVLIRLVNVAPNLIDCLSEPGLTSKQGLLTYTITG